MNLFVHVSSISGTFTIIPDIEKQLTVDERIGALSTVLDKKGDILSELDRMASDLGNFPESQQAMGDLRTRVENRMAYLEEFLRARQ
jgi:hypothetical protein